MHAMRRDPEDEAQIVGWGLRVLLLTGDPLGIASATSRRLAGLGGVVEVFDELFSALEALIEDPRGHDLCVLECDAFGGRDKVQQALSMVSGSGRAVPVILISADCAEQVFPEDRHEPILLRAPVSVLALRVGLQHAARDRLAFAAA